MLRKVRTALNRILRFFSSSVDNLIRSYRIRSLPKGDLYLLERWVDKKRFMIGTKEKLRDTQVYEAGMSKEWKKILEDWGLSIGQYEAVLISCRGHIPWAPLQYYRSHHD